MVSRPLNRGLVRLGRISCLGYGYFFTPEARNKQDRLYLQRADYCIIGNKEVCNSQLMYQSSSDFGAVMTTGLTK